jgi:hypothetical protein
MKMFSKLTLAVIAFVGMTQVISAQTVGKSAWMIGGSANFTSFNYKNSDATLTVLTIDPTLGYFIADDLAIGLNVSTLHSNSNGEKHSETSLGPFIRYYIADPIFIHVRVDVGLNKGAGTLIGAKVGYSLFLNNSVAIEPAVFYDIDHFPGDASNYMEFGVSLGIQAFCNRNHA